MRIEELEVALKLPLLAPHAAYLRSILLPSVDIWSRVGETRPESGRFGGLPFVPPDFQWPGHRNREYRFLGQINFSEIEDRPENLPETGLLSLFYVYDESGNVGPTDPEFIVTNYWSSVDGFVLHEITYEPNTTVMFELHGGVDLPTQTELRSDWPLNESETDSLNYDLPEIAPFPPDQLLGYPRYNRLAYDPTPGEDWVSLLSVCSIDEWEWCWEDGDMLMIFIEKQRLESSDFSNVQCEAG